MGVVLKTFSNMKNKIILLAALFLIVIAPWQASAFWWSSKKVNKVITTSTNNAPQSLSEQEKTNTVSKLKLWKDSFDKKNVEAVIANQDKFSFSEAELNYLINLENKLAKKPAVTNVGLTLSDGNINIAANFHKFVSGRFSFIAKIISVDNKAKFKVSHLKLYNFSIPAKWMEEPLNEALDKYFSFLYQDSRYQGFSFVVNDGLVQFKPEFKK